MKWQGLQLHPIPYFVEERFTTPKQNQNLKLLESAATVQKVHSKVKRATHYNFRVHVNFETTFLDKMRIFWRFGPYRKIHKFIIWQFLLLFLYFLLIISNYYPRCSGFLASKRGVYTNIPFSHFLQAMLWLTTNV